jgi:hypothetical protein
MHDPPPPPPLSFIYTVQRLYSKKNMVYGTLTGVESTLPNWMSTFISIC